MTNNTVIPIVSASDETYAPYLGVMIQSLLNHLPDNYSVIFYIIDDHISEQSKEHLSSLGQIQYLSVNKALYQHFLESDHITKTAYYRISIPDLFVDLDYEKVLYLDADMLILDDISKLFQTDIGNAIVGAVIDPGQAKASSRLGIATNDYYFNSGALLIQLQQWRKSHITKKTINYLTNFPDKIIYHDQDALNATLYENWFPLHPKWNMQTSLIFRKHTPPDAYYAQTYEEAIALPSIIHFTGHDKPWNTLQNHPYTQAYLAQLHAGPFKRTLYQTKETEEIL
ncbi:glycosyltransferase family 8 protein [Carnobacterium divergens]|uniref:glycosyltransferase family 8 protein n=1 Tax=Carnobacterium divergens TaxID=2748 RepID=UPI0039B0AF6A